MSNERSAVEAIADRVAKLRSILREGQGEPPRPEVQELFEIEQAIRSLALPSPEPWISVAEILPTENTPVLCMWDGAIANSLLVMEAGVWRSATRGDEYSGITHWMPLPNPPASVIPKPTDTASESNRGEVRPNDDVSRSKSESPGDASVQTRAGRRVPAFREWLIAGGGGHEDGEDGIRAGMWSVGHVIEVVETYLELRGGGDIPAGPRQEMYALINEMLVAYDVAISQNDEAAETLGAKAICESARKRLKLWREILEELRGADIPAGERETPKV